MSNTIDVDGIQRPVHNNEGRLIHSTEEGIRNFWRWFGDSRVVDSEGRPHVVYHGTGAARFGAYNPPAFFGMERSTAAWFAAERGDEDPRIEEAYLSIKRPFELASREHVEQLVRLLARHVIEATLTDTEWGWEFHLPAVAEHSPYEGINPTDVGYVPAAREALLAEGYDGIFDPYDTIENTEVPIFVAFISTQIKSATHNPGSFDPENPAPDDRPHEKFAAHDEDMTP